MKLSFKNFPIKTKLFVTFSLLFLVLLIMNYLAVTYVLNGTINQSLARELENSTRTAVEMVRSHAQITIRNHLRNEANRVLSVVGYIHDRGRRDGLTEGDIRLRADGYLLTRRIGDTGYIYVVDSLGQVLVHPYDEVRDTSVIEYDFVQQQISEKEGYLEYSWKNPDDDSIREKVLYMEHYAPWDWIVSVSAYKDEFHHLIRVDDFRESIQTLQVGDGGYLFVFDQEGDILIHPDLAGQNYRYLNVDEELDLSLFDDMLKRRNGTIRYRWLDADRETVVNKMLLFREIPELGWIVASSVYIDEYSRVIGRVHLVLLGIFIVSLVFFLVASRQLARQLSRPLTDLVLFLEESSGTDYSRRFPYAGRDEFSLVADRFNLFLEDLETEKRSRKAAEEKNRILAQFPEGNPHSVLRIDRSGRILYANPASQELFHIWGTSIEHSLPDDLLQSILGLPESFGSVEYLRHGSYYNVMYTFYPSQKAYYLFITDITERKNNEYLLLLSENVFANTMEGITITDPEGNMERINRAFTEITGYTEEDVIGRNPRILKSDHQTPDFYREMRRSLADTGKWSGDIWNRRKNGEVYPEWLTISSIRNDRGDLLHYVAVFKDISDLKRSEEQLRYQAYHDVLTGLPNRSLFEDRLERAIAHAERKSALLAVLFLDMDNFKNINDSLGHNVGDRYLRIIAERLKENCREEDTVARLGGDEFVILIPEMPRKADVVDVAQRVQAVLGIPIHFEHHEILPSVSIGVTFFPEDGKDPQLLMKNADMAMYRSKQTGKGTYSLFNEEMNLQVQHRIEMESRLRRALERDELRIAYQPKVSVRDRKIYGAEALIRWNNPDLGVIPPGEFISLAEETGFILEMGDWVLKTAVKDLEEFQAIAGESFEMAVNLSARQFRDRKLIRRIERIVNDSPASNRSINFEITENLAMEDTEASLAILDRLYNLSVRISIDDFGTGYSSLSYLKRFKTHFLKIDKSFIDELPSEEKTAAIVRNIIELGHTLGMEIVAEGVETKEQYDFLKSADCDFIQGYYFSRPLFRREFLDYLRNSV